MRTSECQLLILGVSMMVIVSFIVSVNRAPQNPADYLALTAAKSKDIAEKEGIIQQLQNKLACLTKGVLPSGGFCLDSAKTFQGGNDVWDGKLCAGMEEIFGHSSVGDFGAGLGHYGSCFLRLGGSVIKTSNKEQAEAMAKRYTTEMTNGKLLGKAQVVSSWEGFDSAFNVEEVSGGKIHTADLSISFKLDHKFDWVMSLEVGEHIPREKEDVFIDNLVFHACKGVVLSWALEGQGGYNHINNRNNDYIIEKMKTRGLVFDEKATKKLKRMATVYWFKNSVMVFNFPKKKC